MNRITPAATAAVIAPETDAVFLHLITIKTSGGVVLRFVDNNQDIVSRGETYTAAGFTIVLPEQTDSAPRPCKLAIDNTDLAIFQIIKQAAGQTVTFSVCVIMADSPDTWERGPLNYKLRNVRVTKESIEGDVYDFYLADRKFPRWTYTPEDFEGMYY